MGLHLTEAQEKSRTPQTPILNVDSQQVVYVDSILETGERLTLKHELWIVDSDGTNKRQLTSGPGDQHPRFSPDGRKIVFSRDNDL